MRVHLRTNIDADEPEKEPETETIAPSADAALAALGRRQLSTRLEPGVLTAGELTEARRQLHHAAQLIAATGRCFAAPLPDDAHANLGWSHELKGFVTRPLESGDVSLRSALLVREAAVAVCTKEGRVLRQLPLVDRVRNEVAGWIRAQLSIHDLPAGRLQFDAPYEIPDHPVAGGRRYMAGEPEEFAELGRWYALGQRLFDHLRDETPGFGEIRCWPHHFDLAMQLPLGEGRSVGVGLSLGDEHIPEPYLYVLPWPAPTTDALPPLKAGGRWHTDGFVAATLDGETLLESTPPLVERAAEFVEAAVAAARQLVSDG